MKPRLTIPILIAEAKGFCEKESRLNNKELFGVTDRSIVGDFILQQFKNHLLTKYSFTFDSSPVDVTFPSKRINTIVRTFPTHSPASFHPFKSLTQKIYGLDHNLLVFEYEKVDNSAKKTSRMRFTTCFFVEKNRTADFRTTRNLRQMLDNDANDEDIAGYLNDALYCFDDSVKMKLANAILRRKPEQGYLNFSRRYFAVVQPEAV